MIIATPTMFLTQGQLQPTHQQDLIEITERAQQKVESLFEWIESQQIDVDLQATLDTYKTYDEDGKVLLESAYIAIEEEDYESAVEDVIDALRIFRDVIGL